MPPRPRSRKARVAALRGQLQAQGLGMADIARRIARDERVNLRVAWRLAHGLTQEEVADRYNAQFPPHADAALITAKQVSYWENWPQSGREPSLTTLGRLARIYRCTTTNLIADHETAAGAIEETGNGAQPPSAEGGHQRSAARDIDRERPFNEPARKYGEANSAQFPLEEMAAEAVELARWAEVTNVGSATLSQLDDAVNRIARGYSAMPPAPLISRAAGIRSQVLALLREHQRLAHRRDLFLIGAKVCAFLAWALSDLGQQRTAAAHGHTALTLAGESGHRGARALALSAQSKIAFFDGTLAHAASLARQGYESCPPNTTRVLLACQEADAADIPDAADALRRAGEAHEQITAADDLGGPFSCGHARRACYTMSLRLRHGEPRAVLQAAEAAVSAYRAGEECSYGTRMQVQLAASIALLRAGEPEGAAGRLAPVLELPPAQRLVTIGGRLGQVRAILAGPRYRGSQTAAELAARIDEYFREPGTGLLPYPVKPLGLTA